MVPQLAFKLVHFAPVTVAEDGFGGHARAVQPIHQFGKAFSVQPAPEDARQSGGQAIEPIQIQTGMLDKQRAAND